MPATTARCGAAALILACAVPASCGGEPQSRAGRMVADCREQLRAELPDGARVQWSPELPTVGVRRNGIRFTTVELRTRMADGRPRGYRADCDFQVQDDSAFVRYRFDVTEVFLLASDTTGYADTK